MKKNTPGLILLLLAAVYVYAPSLYGGWLWDDFEIRENLQLRTWSGLLRMWYAPATPDYAPIRTLLYWIEWHLWGDGLFGFHLTSIALHVCAAWMLWRVLDRLAGRTPRPGWLAAMLFIVHPVAVESVAWLSEIKNTFSLALLLGAFWCWIEFDAIRWSGRSLGRLNVRNSDGNEGASEESRSISKASAGGALSVRGTVRSTYFAAFGLFVLALLVKASVVMFPVGLLLYAWWRRGRVRWADVLASLPFFVVSVALGAVTILFQMSRAIAHWNLPQMGLPARIAQAGLAIVFYFGKCLVPVDTMPIYPAWRLQPLGVWEFWPWALIGGVVILLVALRRRAGRIGGAARPETLATPPALESEQASLRERAGGALSVSGRFAPPLRHLIFGLCWFVLFLLPVIGFIPMAYQHVAPVADHLCYLSLAVFVCLAAVGISGLSWEGGAARPETLTALPALGSEQASAGPSAPPQFTRLLIFGLTCVLVLVLAHSSRRYAKVFADQETLWTYNLAHNSTSPAVYVNLGFIEHHDGNNAEAIANYKKAIQLDPDDAQAEDELASIYIDQHDTRNAMAHYRQAIAHYERALALDPTLLATRRSLGKVLEEAGQTGQAIAQFQRILRENPKDAETETNYGKALGDEGRMPEAIVHLEKALALDPDSYDAENSLGMAFMAQRRPEEAKRHVEEALRLDPDFAEAENNLGFILVSQGLQGAAVPHFEEALRLKPSLGQAENNLGFALAVVNRMPEAITHLQRAVNLAPADPNAHYNLAIALAATGRREPALAELKAALELNPNFAAAKQLYRRLGNRP